MGSPRKLDGERIPLEDLVEEVLFTKLMIRNTTESKAQVAAADKLHGDAEAQLTRERGLYTALLEAETRVAIGNRVLDEWVGAFRGLLESKRASGGADLFGRFFGSRRPSEVIRMPLGAELALVEPWVESLKADADAELKAQGAALEKVVAAGSTALAAHKAARQALKDFRSGARAALFNQVNSGRAALFGALRELDKGRTDAAWAESFFRPSRRPDEADEPTVAEANAQLETQRAALKAAEARLAEAQQREALAQAELAAREAKEKERDAARKELMALRDRLAELEAQLR
ncbi:MAG: hypothetical protein U1A78_04655 [Polyangia bacterium]